MGTWILVLHWLLITCMMLDISFSIWKLIRFKTLLRSYCFPDFRRVEDPTFFFEEQWEDNIQWCITHSDKVICSFEFITDDIYICKLKSYILSSETPANYNIKHIAYPSKWPKLLLHQVSLSNKIRYGAWSIV